MKLHNFKKEEKFIFLMIPLFLQDQTACETPSRGLRLCSPSEQSLVLGIDGSHVIAFEEIADSTTYHEWKGQKGMHPLPQ